MGGGGIAVGGVSRAHDCYQHPSSRNGRTHAAIARGGAARVRLQALLVCRHRLQALCASRIETGARSVGESRQMCACESRECPSQRSVERATQRCASTRVWEGLALEGRRTGYAAVSWGGATAGSGRGASGGESGSCERRPSAPTRSNERHARSTHTAATREPWLDGKAGNPNMCGRYLGRFLCKRENVDITHTTPT